MEQRRARYGSNETELPRSAKKFCNCTLTPLFYFFLLVVAVSVTCADKFLYEYDNWYIQGSAMLVMVLITFFVFGCGRFRLTKRQKQQVEDQDSSHFIPLDTTATVKRQGTTDCIIASSLVVGDIVQF